MKQKYLYTAFILATILVLVLVNRKSATKTSAVVENKIPQEISLQQNQIPQAQLESALLKPSKPRITIIKKASPKEAVVLPETKQTVNVSKKKETPSPGSYTAAGEEAKSLQANEKPAPGVTKIGKRPSQQTVNELNEQGIVLY